MARGLKFRIKKVEALYYLCSENKGADQLRGHREADLRLCFRICKYPVFSRRGSFKVLFGVIGIRFLSDIVCLFICSYPIWVKNLLKSCILGLVREW